MVDLPVSKESLGHRGCIFWSSIAGKFGAGSKCNKVPSQELDQHLCPIPGCLVHSDPVGEPVHDNQVLVTTIAEVVRTDLLKWIV